MNDFNTAINTIFPDWQYGHPVVIYGLIRSMKPAVCVEVGTYLGFGAAWMAKALQENGSGHLYCIDNFGLNDRAVQCGNPRQHMERNIAMLGLSDWVTIIEGDSDKVEWPEKVDLAYIDGWHSYLAASHDFEQCELRGAECICLDDTTQSVGPRKLVSTLSSDSWSVLSVERDCGLAICMRRKPRGPITFSQELPDCPGVDLQTLTRAEQRRHFEEASRLNGLDYSSVLTSVHHGRGE